MRVVAIVSVLLAWHARPVDARSACNGDPGWSPASAVTLPPRAELVFRWDRREEGLPGKLVVTIDGNSVPFKQSMITSKPWRLVVVDIDSDRTGTLVVGFADARGHVSKLDRATYTIAGAPAYPKEAKATTSRYHHKIGHTSVREVFDGLEIKVDVPATLAHVRLRRDPQAAWSELAAPVVDGAIHIGELGCTSNYSPALLEVGVDLDVAVALPDGSLVPVKGLSHAILPRLAKPTSTIPSDSE